MLLKTACELNEYLNGSKTITKDGLKEYLNAQDSLTLRTNEFHYHDMTIDKEIFLLLPKLKKLSLYVHNYDLRYLLLFFFVNSSQLLELSIMALDKPYFETSDAYLFGLKRFSNLGKLTLHLKQIRLPENFFRNFPRLENLHLSGNSVIGLQESAINSLKYLKKFTFSVTSFVGEGWSWTPLENMGKVVEKYFNKLDSLEVLRLSNCFIPELNEDMFRNLTNLDTISHKL